MVASNRARTSERATSALHAAMKTATTATGVVRELADLGYIIVPKPYDKPARRGREIADEEARKRIAEHDPWIGKSHSARLCGG